MNSIFNFQQGDFYNSSPDWITYISLFVTVIGASATIFAVIAAYRIYNKQREDSAEDAYSLFQESLQILNDAVDKTIEHLKDFQGGLANPNDDFISPSLPVNLNDKFMSKIDLSSLTRYYEKRSIGKLKKYKEFLRYSNYVGVYHSFFLSELNEFRTVFREKEKIFQQHRLLASNILSEVVSYHRERRVPEFGARYLLLIKTVLDNEEIVKNGAVINRNLLCEKFVRELALMSNNFIDTDGKAIEVNLIANEILSARDDMNNLKLKMAQNIGNTIGVFGNIKETISELIEIN